MKTITELKRAIKNDPQTADMIRPSVKNEIFLDWDGNGTVDFAFISSKDDGIIDTFAVDLSEDGECDMYFSDTDRNGVFDDIQYYPDGWDMPSYTYKGREVESLMEKEALNVLDLLEQEFNGSVFISVLKAVKAQLFYFSEHLHTNGELGYLKRRLREYSETTDIILPSSKNEIYLDMNRDGNPDFAFISSKNDNNIDMFAVDTNGSGEFNLYLRDADGNGMMDDIRFYADDSDEPQLFFVGPVVEKDLKYSTMKFVEMLKKDFNMFELVDALKIYRNDINELFQE